MKAFSVAMPKIDMSAFEVMHGFSTEALGLTKAMESVAAPMHDALSSVAFDQLEAVRRDAARSMKAFEVAMPMIDMSAFEVMQGFSTEAVLSVLEDDALVPARELVDSLRSRPLIELSVEDLMAAREVWDRIETEIDSLRFDLDVEGTAKGSESVIVLGTLITLLAVEAASSQILLDLAVFSLKTLLGLLQLTWLIASHPSISGPMGTFGGLAGIIGLVLYLRDRESDR